MSWSTTIESEWQTPEARTCKQRRRGNQAPNPLRCGDRAREKGSNRWRLRTLMVMCPSSGFL